MEFYEMSALAAAKQLKSDTVNGLDDREAGTRLLRCGRNKIDERKRTPMIKRFLAQFNDFMIIILLGAAAVSYITSLMSGEADITESVIILAIVMLNALLGVIQEARAEHSLEALKKLSSPHARVIRGGRSFRINSEEIVPGDIIELRAGDMVCADCRLISCNGLSVDESPLTGEAHPVAKDADITLDPLTGIADMKNMVHASTHIISGRATALVVKTGMKTEVGRIASLLLEKEPEQTPLQKRLADTGKTLCFTALLICGVIFIIGMIKHIPPFEMFMTSVSLAVAAIPEGLPAIVTIVLALGVVKMSSHNAIVRNLPSVETLGCATVICTDKTGTLTQNKMSVHDIRSRSDRFLLELCSLASEKDSINPTDSALAAAAKKRGMDCEALSNLYPVLDFIPFDSVRKRVTALRKTNKGVRTIVKGAPEYVLPLCGRYFNGTKEVTLTKQMREKIISENSEMAGKALRVIACAYRDDSPGSKLREFDMVYVGMAGIADPPRPEATEAVKTCKSAGIRTIMITGDHADTALAIASMTGIVSNDNKRVITGAELEKIDDKELQKTVKECSVFARVTPEHKSRIVKALRACGEVTAMTGDGVNDAPALSGADIGCSMGITGTDVAKSASDLILTDDNFATIVYAVREGRAIYDNIKKTVKFLLSSNIGEILTVLFGLIFGCSAPLTAIELLWVNLVTDSFPAIALGLDPPEKDIMNRPPLKSGKGIFTAGLWVSIAFEGLMIGALAVLARSIGMYITGDETTARTMSFFVLSVSQLFHAFNMRSEHSVLHAGLFSNKYLILSLLLGTAAQLAVISVPTAAALFNVTPLNSLCISVCMVLSVLPLVIVELQKAVTAAFSKDE